MRIESHEGKVPLSVGKYVPSYAVSIVDAGTLLTHEDVDTKHLKILADEVKSDGFLKRAIVVDKNTNVILDGHHRIQILKELGCSKIPAIFVDYQSSGIRVQHWSSGERIDKRLIIFAALSGKKLLPKTSRHTINVGSNSKHISFLERRIDIPLEELR